MSVITVAICTRNRAALLDASLSSIAAAERPVSCDLQVLVVLNGCSDDSAEIAGRHASHLPLTVVSQPEPGLSHARNTAVAHATGEFIVWTDDDVRVHPAWLTAYEKAFARKREAAVFGGTIVPVFEDGPPDWLYQALPVCEAAYAAQRPQQNDAPIMAATGVFPYGANFAIRADEQRRRPYDQRLGRRPGRWIIGGEETVVIRALLQAGATGYWVPGAIVEHRITPERQTVDYLRAYFEGRAFVQSSLHRQPRDRRPALSRELRELIAKELQYRRVRRKEPPAVWVAALIDTATARGRLRARLARSP